LNQIRIVIAEIQNFSRDCFLLADHVHLPSNDRLIAPVEQVGCVCVCLSVRTITFERNDLRYLYIACRFDPKLSRSSLMVNVISQSSRSHENLQKENILGYAVEKHEKHT